VQVVREPGPCTRPDEGTAVAIGVFDGVHLGHQHVLAEARRLAAERRALSAVVTFDRHPAAVVRPESAPKLLTDLEQRLELLAGLGMDLTYVVTFDEARSKESAEDFIETVLVDCLAAKAVVVGADFHFGHQRRGNVELLRQVGRTAGFEVDGIELLASKEEGVEAISSTAIRAALAAGDLASANRMLGRPHEVRGVVTEGDRRGRELGYPTANVAVPADICLPADGIYAGWHVRPGGPAHPAAINLGRRPTFYADADTSLLETHLLDFEGDLYDEPARVRFVARLRDEVRFDSVDDLVRQMATDVDDARTVLGWSASPG
jgi:riboflavin kinase / FMN adenylyltransferase